MFYCKNYRISGRKTKEERQKEKKKGRRKKTKAEGRQMNKGRRE